MERNRNRSRRAASRAPSTILKLALMGQSPRRLHQRQSFPLESGATSHNAIGNASTVKLCLCLGANPRRFRFGGKRRGHIYGVAGAQKLAPRSASFTEVSGEEEAGGVCRGRGYLWIFNRSLLITHTVRALCCKADIAISPGPYILSMAQCSDCGACGFVLAGHTATKCGGCLHPVQRWKRNLLVV
jgi:hypothetical protein